MKALILCGGKGTRLRPITHTSAKQLIPIANKPIVFYGIEEIRDAGITDIGVVLGDTALEVMNNIGDGSKWGVKITYIKQEAPLGLAHAVKISREFLGDDPFVMFLGDNLIKDGIKSLVKEFKDSSPNAEILLAQVKNPSQFGVAYLENNNVIRLEEKPEDPKSDLALVGVYMFDKTIFEAIDHIKPSSRNELEITDAIQYLIDQKYNVISHKVTGWWKDTGKIEDLLEANKILLDSMEANIFGDVDKQSKIEGNVIIEKGAKIINSKILGPAIIGENSVIENSTIEPFTSIYYNVSVKNTKISNSIILEETVIKDIQAIDSSLIGKNVRIIKSENSRKAYSMMIGDSGYVELL